MSTKVLCKNKDDFGSEIDYIIGEHNLNVSELKIFFGDMTCFFSGELNYL